MVKVSVIIPIFNSEKYLRQLLESVLAQTMSDIEVLCVNDASKDNSLTILEEFSNIDKRIKIINCDKPKGIPSAKNKALEIAKGEYITFINPEDYIDSFMFERMYNQAETLNSDIVVCDSVNFDEEKNEIKEIPTFEKATSYFDKTEIKAKSFKNFDKSFVADILFVSPNYCTGKLYSKKLIKSNEIDFSQNKLYADTLFVCKTFTKAENISYINWPFYIHRINLKNTQNKIKNIHRYLLKSYNENKKYLKRTGLQNYFKANLIYYLIETTFELAKTIDDIDFLLLISSFRKHLPRSIYHLLKAKFEPAKFSFFKSLFMPKQNTKSEPQVSKLFISKTLFSQLNKKHDTYILFDNLINNKIENIDSYLLYKNLQKNGVRSCYVALKNSNIKDIDPSDKHIIWLEHPVSTHPNEFLATISKQLLRAKGVITSYTGYSYELHEFFRVNPYFDYIYLPAKSLYIKSLLQKDLEPCYYNYNYVVSTSDEETKMLLQQGAKETNILKFGLPRWDYLNTQNISDEKSVLFMFRGRELNKLQFNSSYYRTQISELLNNKKLLEYFKANDVKVYFAPCADFVNDLGYDFGIKSEDVIIADTRKLSEYIRKCSCLVTDYSSVALDFMYQNKPVLYYLFDKDNSHIPDENDYENFKNTILFNVFDNEKELITKLKGYVDKDFKLYPEMISFYNGFFYPKGNYTEQLTEWLKQH